MAAPHWLVQLVRLGPAPISWPLVGRAALAIAGPIAVGLAVGELATGMQASVGALCGTFVARAGPYRFRLRRIGFACLAGTFGFLAGGVSAGYGWVSSVVLVALAVVSAVVSAVGANASVAGLMMLVFGVLGTGQGGVWDPYLATVWFAVGAAWTLVLAIGAWPMRATLPERAALAAVYDRLATLLTAAGSRASGPARQRLTAAMNDAYDVLLSARSRLEGRDADYRRLFVVLSETTPVVEAGVALHNARRRPSQALIEAVRAVGGAIRTDAAPPPLQQLGSGPQAGPLVVALRGVAAVMRDGGSGESPHRRRPTARERLAARLDALRLGPATLRFAARLGLCVGLAEVLSRQLELERSYWVTLTVALVLKPDFGSVFARAVQRAGGTVLGVLLGAVVLVVDPRGWPLVVLVAVLAGLLPVAQARNYGLFSVCVTPLVIVQLDLAMAG
ncbi:MAG: FUSC family protein, partial [Thermocrispum sp.]